MMGEIEAMEAMKSLKVSEQINTKVTATNSYGKKEQIPFIFPNIVERKQDFCVQHNKHFENECHLLPSIKLHWIGCPICKINDNRKKRMQFIASYMDKLGMKYNPLTRTWESRDEVKLSKQESKSIKVSNYFARGDR